MYLPGCCYCCLTTADKVDIVMGTFGDIALINDLQPSEFPQLVCGRILPVKTVLTAPISGIPCVYYEARAEELVDRTDENGLTGVPDTVDSNKVWEMRCAECVAADFTLVNPRYPEVSLYVPGTQVSIKVHAAEERVRKHEAKKYHHNQDIPSHTMDFLLRNNINLHSHHRHQHHHNHKSQNSDAEKLNSSNVHPQKRSSAAENVPIAKTGTLEKHPTLRFREAVFEYGEKIGVLGIVEEVTREDGTRQKVLLPVRQEHLSEQFCRSKKWGDMERHSWLDLTKQPSIILTDIGKYLQDANLEALPARKSYTAQLPLDLRKHCHSLKALSPSTENSAKEEERIELMSPVAKRITTYSSNSGSDRNRVNKTSERYQIELPPTADDNSSAKQCDDFDRAGAQIMER